jgi:hypothetical protein
MVDLNKCRRRASAGRQGNGKDVPAAAARLHVPITDHFTVARRVGEAVGRIDASLTESQRRGALSFFNQEYRARRRAAAAQGKGFMPYGAALRRLRIAVAKAAADGGVITQPLMCSVFDSVES